MTSRETQSARRITRARRHRRGGGLGTLLGTAGAVARVAARTNTCQDRVGPGVGEARVAGEALFKAAAAVAAAATSRLRQQNGARRRETGTTAPASGPSSSSLRASAKSIWPAARSARLRFRLCMAPAAARPASAGRSASSASAATRFASTFRSAVPRRRRRRRPCSFLHQTLRPPSRRRASRRRAVRRRRRAFGFGQLPWRSVQWGVVAVVGGARFSTVLVWRCVLLGAAGRAAA